MRSANPDRFLFTPKRKKAIASPDALILFAEEPIVGEPSPAIPVEDAAPRAVNLAELVTTLEAVLLAQAPHLDDQGIEMVIRELRRRWTPPSHEG